MPVVEVQSFIKKKSMAIFANMPRDTTSVPKGSAKALDFEEFKKEVHSDYRTAWISRQASLIGRKEVLTGKAKFGIFGDGKEIPQLAMARAFTAGDIRSGYYRDQTFMLAKGLTSIRQFFAQLYAHPSLEAEPASGGRLMNGHFSTRFLDDQGNWHALSDSMHSTCDISPTAGQMGRALGIAYASKLYRHNPAIAESTPFSKAGREISFATIGNAATSEGHFWETLNAAAVLQVPLLISIWDDEFGISVPARYQTAKENLSSLLSGFISEPGRSGIKLHTLRGWDYPSLCAAYQDTSQEMRKTHIPAVFHITELTQPQGHSTSGSHERYKSPERLEWERQQDGIVKMRAWMLQEGIATEAEVAEIEEEGISYTKSEQRAAYQEFRMEIDEKAAVTLTILSELAKETPQITQTVDELVNPLKQNKEPLRRDLVSALRGSLLAARHHPGAARDRVQSLLKEMTDQHEKLFSSHLYSQSAYSTQNHRPIPAVFSEQSTFNTGYEVLNMAFSDILRREPTFFALGEDVGKIGDVNQGFAGLQDLYGENRVTDTGIREMSIVGQGLGAAMRGLRPMAEIQYLDYLLYALQILSDDVATLHYRTVGGQKAPLIVRTRGHRLEGIWHSGSPMGMILHSIRGMLLLVPRNMVQAAGFYNMLLACDEPAVVIESLNGYRLKERVPDNLFEFTLAPGIPEVLREGNDISVITYGSCCRMAIEAADRLIALGIEAEVIDVQSLIPFDIHHSLIESISKTNRFLIVDEDVPGGASSYIYQQIMEVQQAYFHLDSPGRTLTAREHRPAYGSDGDYFSKPSVDDMVEAVYQLMSETDPALYPPIRNTDGSIGLNRIK